MPIPAPDHAVIDVAARQLAALIEQAIRRVKDLSDDGIVEVSATGTPAGNAGVVPASDSAHASMAIRALHQRFAADVEASGAVPLLFRENGLQVVRIRVSKGSARERSLLCGPEGGPYANYGVAKACFADGLAAVARLSAAGWFRPTPDTPSDPVWDIAIANEHGQSCAMPAVHARTAQEAIQKALRVDITCALLRGAPPIRIVSVTKRQDSLTAIPGVFADHPAGDLIAPILAINEG